VVARVLGGEVNAFARLFEKYNGYVAAIVQRHLPSDHVAETVQDVFIRAYRSLGGWRRAESFRQWLATIAVRACYDFWRREYRRRETAESRLGEGHRQWLQSVLAEQARRDWEALGRRAEARAILNWALAQLGPEDRMVLELVHLEGRSIREAARLLGWTAVNVKVRAHRARQKLKKLLLA
jgi:RNA polymerase sigma-70 factor (ECF subfamily)